MNCRQDVTQSAIHYRKCKQLKTRQELVAYLSKILGQMRHAISVCMQNDKGKPDPLMKEILEHLRWKVRAPHFHLPLSHFRRNAAYTRYKRHSKRVTVVYSSFSYNEYLL